MWSSACLASGGAAFLEPAWGDRGYVTIAWIGAAAVVGALCWHGLVAFHGTVL